MMFRPVRTIAPITAIVSLVEAKLHCRVDHNDDDTLISGLIEAATSHLDGWQGILGRAVVTQTWRQDFEGFGYPMRLPVGPVQSIVSVGYQDASGADQVVSPADYSILSDEIGAFVALNYGKSWPSVGTRADAVRITYVAGLPTPPAAIKQAMLLLIGHWYEHREAVASGNMSEVPMAVNSLIASFRTPMLA
jgi:uncharacterized phiE125 gp8 family phage protein